ncbi:MASE1 domain-containing protein [Streptomyces lushanensis]|uniref:MASE1 domain-containing protein n=1 Tax=Streptomyces lushanensis TaxID=1434255 RepID=UPI000A66BE2E|nr:MASE1 domain-containing protein [Streptomyces lushanensis]
MAAVVRTEELRRLSLAALRILGLAVAYYAGAWFGLQKEVLRADATGISPLWPSTGIALTALLLLGPGVWPGITLGALANITTLGSMNGVQTVVLAGNTLAPLCSLLLLRKAGFRTELDRLRDGVALVFLGGLAGMLVSATTGSVILLVSGDLPVGFWTAWLAWWTGDAMGVLLVTPFLLLLCRLRLPLRFHRWAEASALVVTAAVVTRLATVTPFTLLFLVFPVLIWAALRFHLAGSAPFALLVSLRAIWETTDPAGAFAHHTLLERMISIQAFNGSLALTSLLLTAIVTEQKNVHTKIEEACETLAEVVEQLAPEEWTRLRLRKKEWEWVGEREKGGL